MKASILRRIVQFLILIAVLPFSACTGQPEPRTHTIGVLNIVPALDPLLVEARAELARHGYVEGENLTFLYAGPQTSLEEVDATIQAYLAQDVDIILSLGTPTTRIAQQLTSESQTPVVFAATDPVSSGLVQILSEPGANLTGIATGAAEDRRLEILLQILPDARRIYIPYNPDDTSPTAALRLVRAAADQLNLELVLAEVRTLEEISIAIDAIPADIDAVFLLPDSLIAAAHSDWEALVAERNLPMCTPPPINHNTLVTYGFEAEATGRQLGRIAASVLDGAAPARIPIEPGELVLSIDMRVAEAIGVEVPQAVLVQADRILR
jgi:putative ABC transport system substrate-binding protein